MFSDGLNILADLEGRGTNLHRIIQLCQLHPLREDGRTFAVEICVQPLLQNRRGSWRVTRLILLLLVAFVASLPHPAIAHDLLKTYIQHGVHLTVNTQHVDLTLDLTFFEEWSAKERLSMDTDGNGRISRREMEAYVKKIAPRIYRQVKLTVAGRELAIAPLYDPEVDLLGDDKVGPGHHRLRLFYFARTPGVLRAGDEIVIEESLWPKANALGTLQAESRDGAAFETKAVGDFARPPDQARRFTVRCLRPPTAQFATSASSPITFPTTSASQSVQ